MVVFLHRIIVYTTNGRSDGQVRELRATQLNSTGVELSFSLLLRGLSDAHSPIALNVMKYSDHETVKFPWDVVPVESTTTVQHTASELQKRR